MIFLFIWNRLSPIAAAIGSLLIVFQIPACGGSSENPPAMQAREISGTIRYEHIPHRTEGGLNYDDAVEQRPAPGIAVIAVNRDGIAVANAETDRGGQYTLSWSGSDQEVRVEARAQLPQWAINIADNTRNDAEYRLVGEFRSPDDNRRDLLASSGWTGTRYGETRAAAPFAILATLYPTLENLADRGAIPRQALSIQVNWSASNRPVPGDRRLGEIGSAFFDPGESALYLLGAEDENTDEYDSSVILHELVHVLEHRLSRTDSLGGPHTLEARLDLRLAHSESLANALAGLFENRAEFRDALGVGQQRALAFSLEALPVTDPGWYSEATLTALYFDLGDNSASDEEVIALGAEGLLAALQSNRYRNTPALTSVYSFLAAIDASAPPGEIERLTTNAGVIGRGEFGEGETNNTGRNNPSLLPVFAQLEPGSSVTLCMNNAEGEGSGVDVFRFARVALNETTQLSLRWSVTLGLGEREPRLRLYSRGQRLADWSDATQPERSAEIPLAAGDYVLEVFDALNTDQEPGGGNVCFDIQLDAIE